MQQPMAREQTRGTDGIPVARHRETENRADDGSVNAPGAQMDSSRHCPS